MHGQQVTAERRDDVLVAIEHDIQGERDTRGLGDRPDVVVHRISLDHSPRRARVADPGGVMQHQDGVETSQPRRDEFGPPENPAKKCGSTKPVVILTSASTQVRFNQTGTPSPWTPSQASWS